jgi:hypothetical protein
MFTWMRQRRVLSPGGMQSRGLCVSSEPANTNIPADGSRRIGVPRVSLPFAISLTWLWSVSTMKS